MDVTIRPMGEHAVLVEVAGLPQILALDAALRSAAADGRLPLIVDQIPAARTVLVRCDPQVDLGSLQRMLEILCAGIDLDTAQRVTDPAEEPLVIGVHYDGPDLTEVAALTGLPIAEVVLAHTSMPWRVAFGGFAPGFGYLVDGDRRLQVPRRSEPRTSIPAGSVALAGPYSGIYPRSGPGGWQLIGRTDAVLWAVDRNPPALLRTGRLVRFTDLDDD